MAQLITRYAQYFNIVRAYNEKPPQQRAKMTATFFPAVIAGLDDQRVVRRLLALQAKEEVKGSQIPLAPSAG